VQQHGCEVHAIDFYSKPLSCKLVSDDTFVCKRKTEKKHDNRPITFHSGISTRSCLDDIVHILTIVTDIERDAEVRNQCLLIIAHLMEFIDQPDTNRTIIGQHLTVIIDRCILPNMRWKAGRTAAAIRATAIATLWSIFQAKSFEFQQVDIQIEYRSIDRIEFICCLAMI
jgi:hypothetical protein